MMQSDKPHKVLLTGGSGFIGHNILPILKEEYDIYAPSRQELDVLDEAAVEMLLKNNQFDVVVHAANPNAVKNPLDSDVNMVEGTLRCFMNFYRMREHFGKMIYLGSGAELAKTRDMDDISEDEFDRIVPTDEYGYAKYVINNLVRSSDNIFNLRIFACYGPDDHKSKFITHCIDSILDDESEITIRKDCVFDYMHVNDLGQIIKYFIDGITVKYHDYNVCSGEKHLLSDIADMVRNEMGVDIPIRLISNERNYNYTASNKRLIDAIGKYDFISLKDGIRMMIDDRKGDVR